MAISTCNVQTDYKQKEMTLHGDLLFPVACYEDHMEKMDVPIHWHDEIEYIYAYEGVIELQIGSDALTLYKGQSVLINGNVLHAVHRLVSKKSILRSLVIHPDFIGSSHSCFYQELILPFYGDQNKPYILMDQEKWHHNFASCMMKAWQAITQEIEDYAIESRYLLSKALKLLVTHQKKSPIPTSSDIHAIERMKILIPYLENHYPEPLSNKDLMIIGACSESVLHRSFKKIVGQSPMDYLLHYRIKKAASLLLESSMKVSEIAISVGFNDLSYFTKQFKKITGMTPIQFRKAHISFF